MPPSRAACGHGTFSNHERLREGERKLAISTSRIASPRSGISSSPCPHGMGQGMSPVVCLHTKTPPQPLNPSDPALSRRPQCKLCSRVICDRVCEATAGSTRWGNSTQYQLGLDVKVVIAASRSGGRVGEASGFNILHPTQGPCALLLWKHVIHRVQGFRTRARTS